MKYRMINSCFQQSGHTLACAAFLALLLLPPKAYSQTATTSGVAPYCQQGISNEALRLATARKLYETNLYATRLLITALAENRLSGVVWNTQAQRAIAQNQLDYLDQKGALTAPHKDLILKITESITITIDHPVKWYNKAVYMGKKFETTACQQYFNNGKCGASVPTKIKQWRRLAKQLLKNASACNLTAQGAKMQSKRGLDEEWQLLANGDRYQHQLNYLRNMDKSPFHRNEPLFQLLYVDFFLQSLKGRSVGKFHDYFSQANNLEVDYAYMQKRLKQMVQLLLANRLVT